MGWLRMMWFVLGLGSELQIVASLSMTEVYVLIAAVVLFPQEYSHMKRTGVHVFLWLALLVIVGGLLSIPVHPPPAYFAIRKFATVAIIPCVIIVTHSFLRRCPDGFKWFFVGAAISLLLCTFVFRQAVEVATMGDSAEMIMEGPIYWIRRVKAFVLLPTIGWYMKVPTWFSILAYGFMIVFSMVTTASGRSTALGMFGAILLIVLGGKSQRRMRAIGKHFFFWMFVSAIVVLCLNKTYSSFARSGLLDEEATKKYERQTRGGSDVWHLLMGGRAEAIAPFYLTATEDPIFGLGLCPLDDGHRYAEFLMRFGVQEDYEEYVGYLRIVMQHGGGWLHLPGHSYMGGFWMTYGIFGLVFWIYVCFVLIRYIARDAWAVPEWYGWLACGIPSLVWAIFFSPFAARVTAPMLIVGCLLARAVRLGRIRFQFDNDSMPGVHMIPPNRTLL